MTEGRRERNLCNTEILGFWDLNKHLRRLYAKLYFPPEDKTGRFLLVEAWVSCI